MRIARKREARFHKRQQERAAKTTREQNAAFEEAKRQAAREGAGMGGSSRASGARARARRAKDAVFGEDKKIAGYYKQFNLKYGAPFPEVKAAFRKMMRKYHPDMHSQSPGKQKAAAELTRKLNIAYDALERHLGEKMIETKASRTAMMVAGYRARATDRDDGICKDPWAAALAGEEGLALSKKFDRHFAHMELWMAVRTAYLDAHVSHWTGEHGFGQVVILGAGMDTRAARLAADGVTFFEVDHPATQAYKRERLAELDGYPVDAATYTSCNFETEDFLDRLVAEGFDAGAPAIIVWEGVVPYLTQEAVRGTLSRIASGCDPRTVVTFDYLMKRMAEGIDLPDRDRRDPRDGRGPRRARAVRYQRAGGLAPPTAASPTFGRSRSTRRPSRSAAATIASACSASSTLLWQAAPSIRFSNARAGACRTRRAWRAASTARRT